MADATIADSKHRIWLMLDDVPVLAVDYLLSLQINAMSAEDMYKISPTVWCYLNLLINKEMYVT